MGGVASKAEPKKGHLYKDLRTELKPFDLLLFKGKDFVSDFIRSLQRFDMDSDVSDNFSHVGMVVTSDILDYEFVKPGKIYILESAMSGKLGQGVKTVEGRSGLGVFLRDFDDLVYRYDRSNDTRIAVAPVVNNPFDNASVEARKELKRKFTRFFHTVNGERYDLNPISLLSVISSPFTKIFRLLRGIVSNITDTDEWLICSALIAKAYIEMGILPETVVPKNVYPVDFLGIDDDGSPIVVELPPKYIITPRHFDAEYSIQAPTEDAEYEKIINKKKLQAKRKEKRAARKEKKRQFVEKQERLASRKVLKEQFEKHVSKRDCSPRIHLKPLNSKNILA